MKKNTDWFCKCCKNFFKRENATILRSGSMDEVCYRITNMCTICYKEANDGHEFGEAIVEQDLKNEQDELSKGSRDVLRESKNH